MAGTAESVVASPHIPLIGAPGGQRKGQTASYISPRCAAYLSGLVLPWLCSSWQASAGQATSPALARQTAAFPPCHPASRDLTTPPPPQPAYCVPLTFQQFQLWLSNGSSPQSYKHFSWYLHHHALVGPPAPAHRYRTQRLPVCLSIQPTPNGTDAWLLTTAPATYAGISKQHKTQWPYACWPAPATFTSVLLRCG